MTDSASASAARPSRPPPRATQPVRSTSVQRDERATALDRPWSFLGQIELRAGQALLAVGIMGLVLLAGLVVLGTIVVQQSQTIEDMSRNRVMIGMPQADGSFKSVRQRPHKAIVNLAQAMVNNLYNYDPHSVDQNFAKVRALYDQRRLFDIEARLDEIRSDVVREGLSQLYAPVRHNLVETEEGFAYITQGRVYEYAAQIETDRRTVEIRVDLGTVAPTESNPLGLNIIGVDERRIARLPGD